MEIIRIPAERVKILIGKQGETKTKIEEKCEVSLEIDSEGEVNLDGEPANIFFAKDIVLAIGRGFNPKDALKLAKDNYQLFIFHLREHFPTEKAIKRMKGRVIGGEGRIKKEIEGATQSYISVYGNTVGIIAPMDTIEYTKEAVQIVLNGAPHSTLFTYLHKARREIMESQLRQD